MARAAGVSIATVSNVLNRRNVPLAEETIRKVEDAVQLLGSVLLLEFVGDAEAGEAAPRLAQVRPDDDELRDLWDQLVEALTVLARAGYAHGDLSPYNLLVHAGRLVMIDLPQVVDVVANPQGADFLARDVRVVAAWFTARGMPATVTDPAALTVALVGVGGAR